MDSAQIKKIEEYVVFLARQAEAQEGRDDSQAIQHYVKAADILLALASKAQDQPTWERYTKQAEAYQQRAKKRVPAVQTDPQQQSTPKPQRPFQEPGSREKSDGVIGEKPGSPEGKPGRFGRIIGALSGNGTKTDDEKTAAPTVESKPAVGYTLPSAEELERKRMIQTAAMQTSSNTQQTVVVEAPKEKPPTESTQSAVQDPAPVPQKKSRPEPERASLQATVPYQQYIALLAENRKLRADVKSMVPLADYESLEARNRELIESMGLMVPREDYEKLQDRLTEMVPKSMYLDLQRSLTSMVPKEMYLEAEARATSLKAQLDASVPSKILDELASRVTVLSATASLPPETEFAMEDAPVNTFRKWNFESDEDLDK